jgi:predicted dehydrogenase
MKKKINVALIGSNFALKGYLPVIQKIKHLNLKIICSRNILKNNNNISGYSKELSFENNWKKIFKKNIDLVICSVPPLVQQKILIYNFKYKKKIIFEKPISCNYLKSKYIVKKLKEKKISCDVNLTFLSHPLFIKTQSIIKKKILGKVLSYKIKWSVVSQDLNKKVKSWKTNELQGGGIKNIFLTHVFTYCDFFFGNIKVKKFKFTTVNFKKLKYKNEINCLIENPELISGKINIYTKKKGVQNHLINIFFEKGYLELSTRSTDWTKDFKLKIFEKNKNKTKQYKLIDNQKFKDGRSNQIYFLFAKFLKRSNYLNIDYCLNAEKNNNKII